jgi:hypothetical protein
MCMTGSSWPRQKPTPCSLTLSNINATTIHSKTASLTFNDKYYLIAHPNRYQRHISEMLRDMKMNMKPTKHHGLSALGTLACRDANNTPLFLSFLPKFASPSGNMLRSIVFWYYEAETPPKSGFTRRRLRRLFLKPKPTPTGRLEIGNAFPGMLCAYTESHAFTMSQYTLILTHSSAAPVRAVSTPVAPSIEAAVYYHKFDPTAPQKPPV